MALLITLEFCMASAVILDILLTIYYLVAFWYQDSYFEWSYVLVTATLDVQPYYLSMFYI